MALPIPKTPLTSIYKRNNNIILSDYLLKTPLIIKKYY